jgi:hypothetical protein
VQAGENRIRTAATSVSGNITVAGGGIYNDGAGNLTVASSTICGNFAPVGADLSNHGTATLTNSKVCVSFNDSTLIV